MATARERLRALLIFNPHNAAARAAREGGVGVYIDYRPRQTGRGYRSAAWQVIRPGYQTDPDGHWLDQRHKTFLVSSRDEKGPQLTAAQTWAGDRYGVETWVKVPGLPGSWFPEQDAAIIKQLLREAAQ